MLISVDSIKAGTRFAALVGEMVLRDFVEVGVIVEDTVPLGSFVPVHATSVFLFC